MRWQRECVACEAQQTSVGWQLRTDETMALVNASSHERQPRRAVVDQRGGNVALDLFVLSQHLGQFLDHAFDGSGLTPSLYAVYSQLAQAPKTPRQLGDVLGVRPPTLSGYLATMDKRGHLSRTPHQSDGRSTWLELTAAGREQWQNGRVRMRFAVRALNAQLGGADGVQAVRSRLAELDNALLAAAERLVTRA
jgi:DNA-binding MarR family transcriptional regulator